MVSEGAYICNVVLLSRGIRPLQVVSTTRERAHRHVHLPSGWFILQLVMLPSFCFAVWLKSLPAVLQSDWSLFGFSFFCGDMVC